MDIDHLHMCPNLGRSLMSYMNDGDVDAAWWLGSISDVDRSWLMDFEPHTQVGWRHMTADVGCQSIHLHRMLANNNLSKSVISGWWRIDDNSTTIHKRGGSIETPPNLNLKFGDGRCSGPHSNTTLSNILNLKTLDVFREEQRQGLGDYVQTSDMFRMLHAARTEGCISDDRGIIKNVLPSISIVGGQHYRILTRVHEATLYQSCHFMDVVNKVNEMWRKQSSNFGLLCTTVGLILERWLGVMEINLHHVAGLCEEPDLNASHTRTSICAQFYIRKHGTLRDANYPIIHLNLHWCDNQPDSYYAILDTNHMLPTVVYKSHMCNQIVLEISDRGIRICFIYAEHLNMHSADFIRDLYDGITRYSGWFGNDTFYESADAR